MNWRRSGTRRGRSGHDPKNPRPESEVPLLVHDGVVIDHPVLKATFRTGRELAERLGEALADSSYLLGKRFTFALCLVPAGDARRSDDPRLGGLSRGPSTRR